MKGLLNEIIISFKISGLYLTAKYLDKAKPALYTDSFPIPLLPKVFISRQDSMLLVIIRSRSIISLIESQLSQSAPGYMYWATPSANHGGTFVAGNG